MSDEIIKYLEAKIKALEEEKRTYHRALRVAVSRLTYNPADLDKNIQRYLEGKFGPSSSD